MTDQKRNLTPHKAARAAMFVFSQRYAQQCGGSMDFWDSLEANEKKLCKDLVQQILKPEKPTLPENPLNATHWAKLPDNSILYYQVTNNILLWAPASRIWIKPEIVPYTLISFDD